MRNNISKSYIPKLIKSIRRRLQAVFDAPGGYGHMITGFLKPAIEEYDLKNMWFQQDDAICHTTQANMALLQQAFPGRVISRRGDINWPLRSCDLTPLDVFYEDMPRLCR